MGWLRDWLTGTPRYQGKNCWQWARQLQHPHSLHATECEAAFVAMGPQAIPALLGIIPPSENTRSAFDDVLDRPSLAGIYDATTERMRRTLRDDTTNQKTAQLRKILLAMGPKAADELVRICLEHGEESVRQWCGVVLLQRFGADAARALALRLGGHGELADQVPVLLKAFREHPTLPRQLSLWALMQAGSAGFEAIAGLLTDPNPDICRATVDSLIGIRRSQAGLMPRLPDHDGVIVRAICRMLAQEQVPVRRAVGRLLLSARLDPAGHLLPLLEESDKLTDPFVLDILAEFYESDGQAGCDSNGHKFGNLLRLAEGIQARGAFAAEVFSRVTRRLQNNFRYGATFDCVHDALLWQDTRLRRPALDCLLAIANAKDIHAKERVEAVLKFLVSLLASNPEVSLARDLIDALAQLGPERAEVRKPLQKACAEAPDASVRAAAFAVLKAGDLILARQEAQRRGHEAREQTLQGEREARAPTQPCELCRRPISEDEVELVSYYDLTEIGTVKGFGYSAPLDVILKGVFPKFIHKSFVSNLSNWEVCATCHKQVRHILGDRNEFRPRHY
jgi:hypothetical protein